jgi:aspartate/methionine/tyrosine aminotransferase
MTVGFSRRSRFAEQRNALTEALEARRAAGLPVIDLTASNPTCVGLEVDPAVLGVLGAPEGRFYRPDPRGLRVTREAIAGYHAARGVEVSPDQVIVTASTSEAYALCFMLLCDPGDRVLTPAPGYPLFDVLAQLQSVELEPYSIHHADGWAVDLHAVDQALAAGGVRALISVNPGNPTGAYVSRGETRHLAGALSRHGAALVVDEVFGDYALTPTAAGVPADSQPALTLAGTTEVLTFCLSGLSKPVGLPQLKLGWITVSGPQGEREQALARLEMINDSFLSASTAAQLAAPELLARRAELAAPIQARVRQNLAALDAALAARPHAPVQRLSIQGGWYAVLRVPRSHSEEEWGLALLGRGVLLHPGYFFDFQREGHLVVSLLARPDELLAGLGVLLELLGGPME